MPDTSPDRPAATLADYERFVAARPDHERWELIAGVITAMTDPYLNHGLIVGNIFGPLRSALAGGPCRAVAGGLRVQRSDARGEDFAAIPDIVALRGARPNKAFTAEAVAVVEVLSRSTMHRDRGAKFDFYRSLPTLEHIVFVYQGQMRVEHVRRTPPGWILSVLTRPTDRLDLDALGLSLDLDGVYLDVPVLRPIEAEGVDEDEPPVPIP